jgi:CxxC motif-containing protein (DUF1111 family)
MTRATTWIVALAAVAAASGGARALGATDQSAPRLPGGPLPGITPQEFAEFRLGLDDFLEVESAEEGLGPAFNGASCAVCHHSPAVGGMSAVLETRAGYVDAETGAFRGLDSTGETLLQLFSIPTHGCQPQIPDDVNVIARRAPIPLFGAGLVEAIPDGAILDWADPEDLNRDGVSGRAGMVRDPGTGNVRVGRFGWKAQQATLLAFGADAYRNEMGITNDLFPDELAVGVPAANLRLCDPIPDPEDIADPRTRRRGIDNFASFMRFLAPVERGPVGPAEREGEQVFMTIGCASCHRPAFVTAPSANPLFDRKIVALYSDLLLHDIGTGDGIAQAGALPDEIRTPALWGLRFRRPLLHDGRATTVEQAVGQHRNEAELARRGFDLLSEADRLSLLAFLRSL